MARVRQWHQAGPCRNEDCGRLYCRGYRLGYAEGYEDGYSAGSAADDP